jgi:hypothetical protein
MITDFSQMKDFSLASKENRTKFPHELFFHTVGLDGNKTDLLTEILDKLIECELYPEDNSFTFCSTTIAGMEILYLYFKIKEDALLAKIRLSDYAPIYNHYSVIEIDL